jgi:hypothetical protein
VDAHNKSWTRVEKDMIIVLPFEPNCPKTNKQNIIRPLAYHQFEVLINHIYEGIDELDIVQPHGQRQDGCQLIGFKPIC